jgi:hypothetical protein
MTKIFSKWIAAIALALPLAGNATILQFNTALLAANELSPTSFNALASGVATLFYDTSTDTYSFSLSAMNLSSPVTGAHIHALASAAQNGPVQVALDALPFVFFNSGGTLLIGGSGVTAPVGNIPAGNSFATQSFLSALQNGLAYINVHTTSNTGGEIRGQLAQVSVVPEIEVSTMMFAGLGLMGVIALRRRRT